MIRISDGSIKDSTAIALGNFDGLHIGHRTLICAACDFALNNRLSSAILSFSPHPVKLLRNPNFLALMSSEEKAYMLSELKLDYFIEYPFTKALSATKPEDFVNDILIEKFKCKALFIGETFRFGQDGIGDCNLLTKIGAETGMKAVVIPDLTEKSVSGERKVSSSWIRQLIVNNEFRLASKLMGHPYFIMGDIVHNKGLGRKLGFPTANLIASKEKLIPQNGVYATVTSFEGHHLLGMTNIGVRPTVSDSKERQIETHVFDFSGDIYSKKVRISFLEWIRDEKQFTCIEELKAQLVRDEIKVRGMDFSSIIFS